MFATDLMKAMMEAAEYPRKDSLGIVKKGATKL
jgi:hypothetical protein